MVFGVRSDLANGELSDRESEVILRWVVGGGNKIFK
jgi:hypothetical protein